MRTRLVLVRPWRTASAGGGCCSAAPADVCLDHGPVVQSGSGSVDEFTTTYRQLAAAIPAADIQVVSATNTAYLLPWAYRSARMRCGRFAALRLAMRATVPGAAIVDGLPVGDVATLGADGILAHLAVFRRG